MLAVFDTHAAVKRLIFKGFKEEQAEEVIKIFTESQEYRSNETASTKQVALLEKDVDSLKDNVDGLKGAVATKADLTVAENGLKADIKAVESELKAVKNELKADIKAVENELKTDIKAVRNELLLAIEKTKNSTLIMVGGATIAICTIIIGALQYFIR